MEESYSFPAESPEDCHSNPGRAADRTVGNLKDLRRKTEDQLLIIRYELFVNWPLIGSLENDRVDSVSVRY